MKKLIAFTLIAVMVLGLAACGTVNKTEVSVLWSGEGVVKVPNSLINAMERAMYSVNISYKHYGANGDQAEQTKQAEAALNAGCAALVVELVDVSAAQAIVDAAKAKNVPVVFFNCAVEEAVVKSYNKCVLVDTDDESVGTVEAELLFKNIVKEEKGLFDFITGKEPTYSINPDSDKNEDGKISYLAIGDVSAIVDAFNAKLTEKGLPTLVLSKESHDATVIADLVEGSHTNKKGKEVALLNAAEGATVELILVDKDTTVQEVLIALQAKGYNKDRLTTHFIPVYTVGDTADYKALVLADRPAGAHDDEAVQSYYESKQYILDLRNVKEKDLGDLICTTSNIIGDGRLSGTAIEDYDGIAVATATVLRNLLKGNDTFKGIEAESVSGAWAVKVSYTTVG